ncbi:HAD family hydrolase [Streptomyces syringium]|uniref:HAD family hydrolase n=1 Tax=Streptomyces syringium TaxID=76729 RepID=UPI003451868E
MRSRSGSRLALFDLDGTLLDRRAALHISVRALCSELGYGPEVESWLLSELADRASPANFIRMREAFSLPESSAYLWQVYVDRMASAVSCPPAVLDALADLRVNGWRVGVATNGASDIQRAKLHMTGIDALVDGVAVSGDIEVRKPDVRLFEVAAARCGAVLSPDTWVIGDSPQTDVAGAHRAGVRALWLRGRPWENTVPAPHHTADDVVDAITFLLTDCSE